MVPEGEAHGITGHPLPQDTNPRARETHREPRSSGYPALQGQSQVHFARCQIQAQRRGPPLRGYKAKGKFTSLHLKN